MGGEVGVIGSKIKVLQQIINLVRYISMKPTGNVVGIKRVRTGVLY